MKEAKKRNGDLKYDKEHVLSVSGELGIVNQIEHLGRSYAGVSVHQYHVVEVGDIVYTKSPLKANPFGIIRLNKTKAGIVSTLYAVYNVKEQNAYGPFLDYYFSLDANTNRYLRPLVKKGAKNDMKINNAYALHDRIFAPSIPEQKRIAAFFTVLDKKIAQLKEKKALLEQYKKGVMQKLFSQELRFKDENGKDFPKWEKKKLGEVAPLQRGFDLPVSEIKPGAFPVVFSNGILKHHNEYKAIAPGVVTGRSGTIGKVTYVEENYWPHNTSLWVTDFKENYPLFIFYFYFQFNLERFGGGSGVPTLNRNDVHRQYIAIPSNTEQIKIANFLSSIDDKINRTENQIQQTQEYKKGLLQQMYCN